MQVTVFLTDLPVRGQGVKAQEVESDAVRHHILAVHHALLLCRIAIFGLLVMRIVLTQILVQTDADRVVTDDDTLIERTDLRIDLGHLHIGNMALQEGKRTGQPLIDIVHIGILLLGLRDDALQGRVLVETEELRVDLLVVHLSNPEHILYQCPCLHRIDRVHLLQGREIARCQIKALDAVIALYGYLSVFFRRRKLPFATQTDEQRQQQ